MLLSKIPLEKGRYPVRRFHVGNCDDIDPVYGIFSPWISDGDVPGDDYVLLDSEDNSVEIEQFNRQTKELRGSFQVTFVVERPVRYGGLADTLRFTDGRFYVILTDNRRR
jgi:hypothetical protein